MSQDDVQHAHINYERVNEIKKASFWVSQFFILLATVCGVYLAANQGFKQAVIFENMTSYKENYYLQQSLQYELKDNIEQLRTYIKNNTHSVDLNSRKAPLNFYTLVWENMKYSKATLGTPPEVLRDAQRFYAEVNHWHNAIAEGKVGVQFGIEKMQAQITLVEQNLLPRLDKSTAEIKDILKDTKIIL